MHGVLYNTDRVTWTMVPFQRCLLTVVQQWGVVSVEWFPLNKLFLSVYLSFSGLSLSVGEM